MNRFINLILAIVLLIPLSLKASSKNDTISLVYKFDIKQEIGPITWRHTKEGIEEAEKINADLILIHMNTYGGLVDAADSIRTKILNCKIPVYVFIDNNAASAGALISMACDRIYMRQGANIGAATVVDQSGKEMPDKYQSFMRSMIRSTCEAHGKDTIINGTDTTFKWVRDPNIAQAMVDASIYIEGIIDSGKVLTFTTNEAIEHGFCEGSAESVDEVLKLAGIKHFEIKTYEISSAGKIVDFFINPYLSSILIMIIIGGIYFELQSPGIGFPIIASIIAASLYFAPLYIEGLAENWEIIIFFVGIVLLALEVFVIPGFGIAGVSGIILIILGLSLSMVDNVDFEFTTPNLIPVFKSLFIVVGSFFLSIVLSIWLSNKLLTSVNSPLSRFVLHSKQNPDEGFIAVDNEAKKMIGKEGTAETILRPSGKVRVDDEIYDAMANTGFVKAGAKIKVLRFEYGQLYVKEV